MSEENKRERITIRLTVRYMELLNSLIKLGVYNSRNEAIRDALRLLYEHHGLRVAPQKKYNLTQGSTQTDTKASKRHSR